jgi:hypothetical protein
MESHFLEIVLEGQMWSFDGNTRAKNSHDAVPLTFIVI